MHNRLPFLSGRLLLLLGSNGEIAVSSSAGSPIQGTFQKALHFPVILVLIHVISYYLKGSRLSITAFMVNLMDRQ